MEMSGQLHATAANPRESAPVNHWIWIWVGPRAGLDTVSNMSSYVSLNKTLRMQKQLVASRLDVPLHATDWTSVLLVFNPTKAARNCNEIAVCSIRQFRQLAARVKAVSEYLCHTYQGIPGNAQHQPIHTEFLLTPLMSFFRNKCLLVSTVTQKDI
jgi:hypothetical protein